MDLVAPCRLPRSKDSGASGGDVDGDDVLIGGPGNDLLDGGTGDNVVIQLVGTLADPVLVA